MVSRAGLVNQDLEFVQFHPTGTLRDSYKLIIRFKTGFIVFQFME